MKLLQVEFTVESLAHELEKDLQGHAWTQESSREICEFSYVFLNSIAITAVSFEK